MRVGKLRDYDNRDFFDIYFIISFGVAVSWWPYCLEIPQLLGLDFGIPWGNRDHSYDFYNIGPTDLSPDMASHVKYLGQTDLERGTVDLSLFAVSLAWEYWIPYVFITE